MAALPTVLAAQVFLGHDLLAWLILAVGGALVVGNVAALVHPPDDAAGEAPDAQMRRRALAFIAIGSIAAIWALATLLSG